MTDGKVDRCIAEGWPKTPLRSIGYAAILASMTTLVHSLMRENGIDWDTVGAAFIFGGFGYWQASRDARAKALAAVAGEGEG